jgi:hypothetical protein
VAHQPLLYKPLPLTGDGNSRFLIASVSLLTILYKPLPLTGDGNHLFIKIMPSRKTTFTWMPKPGSHPRSGGKKFLEENIDSDAASESKKFLEEKDSSLVGIGVEEFLEENNGGKNRSAFTKWRLPHR